MLQGFHVPLTPRGLSSLNPAPPWHYASDFLTIEFWADPAVVASYLPEGLDPDVDAEGHAMAFFVDWQFSGEGDEYLDPERYQYREFFLLLDAVFLGTPVSYCAYMFVDNDAALARGWSQGYPKRIGSVAQTRLHAAPGKASPQLTSGARFAASMSAHGQRLAQASLTLQEAVTDPAAFRQRPVVDLLHVPQLAQSRRDVPVTHELVMNIPEDVQVVDLWGGVGELTLPIARGEELSDLAPKRCGFGARGSMSYTVNDLRHLSS